MKNPSNHCAVKTSKVDNLPPTDLSILGIASAYWKSPIPHVREDSITVGVVEATAHLTKEVVNIEVKLGLMKILL